MRFWRGKCLFTICGKLDRHYEVDIPPIGLSDSGTAISNDLILIESGFVGLTKLSVQSKSGEHVQITDSKQERPVGINSVFPLEFAVRDEIYQKYSVIAALVSSTVASILTVVNVIVALLRWRLLRRASSTDGLVRWQVSGLRRNARTNCMRFNKRGGEVMVISQFSMSFLVAPEEQPPDLQ